MKYVMTICWILLASALAVQASAAFFRPEVGIGVVNSSSGDIKDVRVSFGSNGCTWAEIKRSFSAINGSYRFPITDQADVIWTQDGKNRREKVRVRGVYEKRKSGLLMFTVTDALVTVSFQPLQR
jgi:hypothetical protein